MAESKSDLDSHLRKAEAQEKAFAWLNAPAEYDRALALLNSGDAHRRGEILDSMSFAFFKAALQAESVEEFSARNGRAIEASVKARECFGSFSDRKSRAWAKRCEATLAYLSFWQATDRQEKRESLMKVWAIGLEALAGFNELKEGREYCRTYLRLSAAALMASAFLEDRQERIKIAKEIMAAGERAVDFGKDTGDNNILALLYARSACVYGYNWVEFESDWQNLKLMNKSVKYWATASEISESATYDELATQAIAQIPHVPVNFMSNESRSFMEKALERAKATGDKFQTACVLGVLSQWISSDMYSAASDDELEDLYVKSLQYGRDSRSCLSAILWPIYVVSDLWIPHFEISINSTRADVEVDPSRRRHYASISNDCLDQCTKMAEASGSVEDILTSLDLAGFALSSLAMSEEEPGRKSDLLEQALSYRKEALRRMEALHPTADAGIGYDYVQISQIEFELHSLASDLREKRTTLEEAIQHMDVGRRRFDTAINEAPSTESQLRGGYTHVLEGRWASSHGTWLVRLFELTRDRKSLEKAIEAFEAAIGYYTKADLPNRRAEVYWAIAKTSGQNGDHEKAADSFLRAADEFAISGKSLPRLSEMCGEYSVYMRAWAEIEQARDSQFRQDYSLARMHYDRAAELHETVERWSYLAENYRAWAQIELGEDLSRNDDPVKAAEAFRTARNLFATSSKSIGSRIAKVVDSEERLMVAALLKAASLRQRYCEARIVLEEAKSHEKKGQGLRCSHEYGRAASILQEIQSRLEADQDKREIELILTLTRAWQAMSRADAEESSGFYLQASALFEKAKDLSSGEKAKLMAMGHSSFCRALEAGMMFTDSGDASYHAAAAEHLESAANHYLKAGLESASTYANASKLLLDGYVFVRDGNKEKDQSKRAKLYAMAEKLLIASASAYNEAGYPGKKEHIERLLVKVKRDKDLAVSLKDILSAPDVASTTMAFSSPMSTQETAAGLDRFEHADVQATLVLSPMNPQVGENFNLTVELVNAGRGSAQLMKLQDAFPEGFILVAEPKGYRMEDSYLNLNGKRIDPLKTEEINLVLRPATRGRFDLKPRVLYLDESGRYKSHELEPVKLTVEASAGIPKRQATAGGKEAAEACSLLAGLDVVTLSHYRIVGNYVRYGLEVRNVLKDARQKIVAACENPSPKRENYIIWAPPGSGKTYFVQEVAALLGDSIHYREINLAKVDEDSYRSALANLREAARPCLCLVDEVDARPEERWPYEALMPFLDASATEGARFVFVLAGSSGSNLEEMKKSIASRPKGSDVLSRVPTCNEYAIPSMGVGDRLLVVLSQFRQAGKQIGREVREVEKLGLYYIALNPTLTNARQLREFAVRCAERVLPGDDRLKYDSLFQPGDKENKLFWTQSLKSAGALVDSFLLIED